MVSRAIEPDIEEIRSKGFSDHQQKVTLFAVSWMLALMLAVSWVLAVSSVSEAIDKYSMYPWKKDTRGAAYDSAHGSEQR